MITMKITSTDFFSALDFFSHCGRLSFLGVKTFLIQRSSTWRFVFRIRRESNHSSALWLKVKTLEKRANFLPSLIVFRTLFCPLKVYRNLRWFLGNGRQLGSFGWRCQQFISNWCLHGEIRARLARDELPRNQLIRFFGSKSPLVKLITFLRVSLFVKCVWVSGFVAFSLFVQRLLRNLKYFLHIVDILIRPRESH